MKYYIYLGTRQKRWYSKIFGHRRSMIVPGGECWPLDGADAEPLVNWCKNHVKEAHIPSHLPKSSITPPIFWCSMTRQECENILKECRGGLDMRKNAYGGPSAKEQSSCQELNELIIALEWCIKNIRWLTTNCIFTVCDNPRCALS